MSDKTKQLILKILIILGTCLLLMIFPLCIPVALLWPEIIDVYYYIVLFAFLGDGIALIVCIFTFKVDLPSKKTAPMGKMPYAIDDNGEIEARIHKTLLSDKYVCEEVTFENCQGYVKIYYKSTWLWNKSCFCIIKTDELSDEMLDNAIKFAEKLLDVYRSTDKVKITWLFCVDRPNDLFNCKVRDGVQQGFKVFHFRAGYSYSDQEVYWAPPKNSLGILPYKKLKRRFLKMIGCQEKK